MYLLYDKRISKITFFIMQLMLLHFFINWVDISPIHIFPQTTPFQQNIPVNSRHLQLTQEDSPKH